MTSGIRICLFLGLFSMLLVTSNVATARSEPNETYSQAIEGEAICADTPEYDLPNNAPFSPDYCAVRKRFFEKFFFDGTIAEGIDISDAAKPHVKFSDQTAYMGFALVSFAAEARILDEHGLDTRSSELTISRIFEEYDKLDNEAELEAYGSNQPGFFVRDFVKPGVRPDMTKIGEHTAESDWAAAPTNKEMSKDQVVHMFLGMWAVSQWAPDHHFKNRAQAVYHTERLINFLKSERFFITLPDSDTVVARGGEALPDAVFLLKMAGATLGRNVSRGAEVRYPVEGFNIPYHAETPKICIIPGVRGCSVEIPRIVWWDFTFEWGGGWIVMPVTWSHGSVLTFANAQKSLKEFEIPITPQVCPTGTNLPFSWIPGMPKAPDLKAACLESVTYSTKYDASSFEYNLVLLEFIFEPNILSSTFNRIAAECSSPQLGNVSHIWSQLLRALYRSQEVDEYVIANAKDWHKQMPEDGPNGDKANNPVWNKDNRWIRCGETNSDPAWIYNGIDFLSLENLTRLHDATVLETGIPELQNHSPVLDPITAITVYEGQPWAEPISASDLDDDEIHFDIEGPGFVAFNDNGDGTGAISLTPTFEDSGEYVVTITVTDPAGTQDQQDVFITVINVNQPPDLRPIIPVSVPEKGIESIDLVATDKDKVEHPVWEWSFSPNLDFVSLDDNGDGRAKLSITPGIKISTAEEDKRFEVRVTVSDGIDQDSETVEITVVNVNQPPVLEPIDPNPIVIREGQHQAVAIEVSDLDGQPVTISHSGLPGFAALLGQAGGPFELTLDPGYKASGRAEVVLTAADPEGATDTQEFAIEVFNVLMPLDTRYQVVPYKEKTGLIDLRIGKWRPDIAAQIEVLTVDGWVDVVNDGANKAWNHDLLQGDEIVRYTYGRNALAGRYRWVIYDNTEEHGQGWLATTPFPIDETGEHLTISVDLPPE